MPVTLYVVRLPGTVAEALQYLQPVLKPFGSLLPFPAQVTSERAWVSVQGLCQRIRFAFQPYKKKRYLGAKKMLVDVKTCGPRTPDSSSALLKHRCALRLEGKI